MNYETLQTFIDPNDKRIILGDTSKPPPTDHVNANVDEQTITITVKDSNHDVDRIQSTINSGDDLKTVQDSHTYLDVGRPSSAPSTIPNETSDEDRKRSLSTSDSLESISSHESLPQTRLDSRSDIQSHQGSLFSSLDVNTSFQSRDGRTSPIPSLDAKALKEVCKSFGSLQKTIQKHMDNGSAAIFHRSN